MTGIAEVLMKATAFVAIIVLGYSLKRVGFFHINDFYLLSKIVIRITLPAAIVANFSKITMEGSLLILVVLGLLCNVVLVFLGYLLHLGQSGDAKAFGILNLSGYNIGNFTMPFVQSFLGPMGFAATSLFDAGNAVMCTGMTYSLASAVKGNGQRASVATILKSLVTSIPFDAYVVMTILAIFQIRLPGVILSFAETAGGANAFVALLMIGIGFEVHADREKRVEMVKILAVRYGTALLFSFTCYFLMPFALEVRQALAILAFAPVSSVAPAFTGKVGGDVELASAVNSISIVISILAITLALIVIL